jgi:hypothetical protein
VGERFTYKTNGVGLEDHPVFFHYRICSQAIHLSKNKNFHYHRVLSIAGIPVHFFVDTDQLDSTFGMLESLHDEIDRQTEV